MPEIFFEIQWPDGEQERCYSPSRVIREYVSPGESYTIPEFLERARTALTLASERVRAKYGYACTSALSQLQNIEARAGKFTETEADDRVKIVGFHQA